MNLGGSKRKSEHLAVQFDSPLPEFCKTIRQIFELPEFTFGAENETKWGSVTRGGVEYNVSKPYREGTLQEWDSTVPDGCNIGIALILDGGYQNADPKWALNELVIPTAQSIADNLRTEVYYHRTWLGVGKNAERELAFEPKNA